LTEPSKPAIEPPRWVHLHLHGLTHEQIAEITTQRGGWTAP
jgi:hypothetical protein